MSRKSGYLYSNIQDLLEVIVESMSGEQIKALASELEISREAIYQMANRNMPEKRFNLRHAVAIAKISRDPGLAEYFASLAELMIVAVPDVFVLGNSLDQSAKNVTGALKRLLSLHIDARDPNGPGGSAVTAAEKLQLFDQAIESLKTLVLYLETLKKEKAVDE